MGVHWVVVNLWLFSRAHTFVQSSFWVFVLVYDASVGARRAWRFLVGHSAVLDGQDVGSTQMPNRTEK